MAEFDRLPPPVRRWLAEAALPWSPRSAGRVFAAALARHGGDGGRALADLDALEAARLAGAGPDVAARRRDRTRLTST